MTPMRFVVTSIAWTEVSEALAPATQRLQEAFQTLLRGHDFGDVVTSAVFVVVANSEDPDAVVLERTRPFSFQQSRDWQGQKLLGKTLYVKVFFTHQDLDSLGSETLLSKVSRGLRETLERRPIRVPKGFDYERFSRAVSAVTVRFSE